MKKKVVRRAGKKKVAKRGRPKGKSAKSVYFNMVKLALSLTEKDLAKLPFVAIGIHRRMLEDIKTCQYLAGDKYAFLSGPERKRK